MKVLQDEQPQYDRAVCDALVASTPEDWNVIVLTLERPKDSVQVGDLIHSISGPDGVPGPIPDDSLYEATYRLDDLFQRYGGVFTKATYCVWLEPDLWRYKAQFEYQTPTPCERG